MRSSASTRGSKQPKKALDVLALLEGRGLGEREAAAGPAPELRALVGLEVKDEPPRPSGPSSRGRRAGAAHRAGSTRARSSGPVRPTSGARPMADAGLQRHFRRPGRLERAARGGGVESVGDRPHGHRRACEGAWIGAGGWVLRRGLEGISERRRSRSRLHSPALAVVVILLRKPTTVSGVRFATVVFLVGVEGTSMNDRRHRACTASGRCASCCSATEAEADGADELDGARRFAARGLEDRPLADMRAALTRPAAAMITSASSGAASHTVLTYSHSVASMRMRRPRSRLRTWAAPLDPAARLLVGVLHPGDLRPEVGEGWIGRGEPILVRRRPVVHA